ncbi:transcriptional initiation protein Tat (plasmid) [Novosphingobium pentaromativorans US6-1]|nr:murein L,D-transpeptidase catalytic domain family protein [Novosphingobium pentaromativorans]AIT82281.1 transcriptional initiation protein Tat [Novosphingobium pentaromativorans US6-1]
MVKWSSGYNRRSMLFAGATLATGALMKRSSLSPVPTIPVASARPAKVPALARKPVKESRFDVNPHLLEKAMAALDAHSARIEDNSRIALVDFSVSSSRRRMYFLDIEGGKASLILVAHGSGSDPDHTGFVERFSNAVGSNASSEGTFLTDDYYVGKHGRSQRLIGLDPTNDNALDRAIVLHSAWYANEDMIDTHGMLGRSQGCFAVGEKHLDDLFSFLGKGRMIYAGRA